jgi:hypothetical protein
MRRSSAGSNAALSCHCVITLAEHATVVMQTSGLPLTSLPYAPSGTQMFDVLVNEDAARVTFLDADATPTWSVIRRSDSRAASLWDYAKRTVFEFSAEQVAQSRIAQPLHHSLQSRKRGSRITSRLSLEDVRAGVFIQEFIFDTESSVPAKLWRALFRTLYGGPSCHRTSGLPMERLEESGCLVQASTFAGQDEVPIGRLSVESVRVVRVSAKDFAKPRGFTRAGSSTSKPEPPNGSSNGVPGMGSDNVPSVPLTPRIALDDVHLDDLLVEEQPTPQCVNSSRLGSIAALLHQDTLTHTTNLANLIAARLGTATLNSGILKLNWLGAITPAGTATPSGLFCLLTAPRIAGPPTSGGNGLLDILAMMNLTQKDSTGTSFLEREAASGALSNDMQAWGITSSAVISDMLATGGDISPTPPTLLAEEILTVDAYEKTQLGMLTLTGLPYATDDFFAQTMIGSQNVQFVRGKLVSLTGLMNFASLAGTPFIGSASIGATGNIGITVNMPTTAVTATATWQVLPGLILAVAGVSAVACFFFPVACLAGVVITAALATFLVQQLAVISATTTAASLTFDISYKWDPAANLVNPFVTLVSTGGSVAVGLRSSSIIPHPIEALVAATIVATGNALNLWINGLGQAIAKSIESGLRSQGLGFPFGPPNLGITAVSGHAGSAEMSTLTLMAEIGPTRLAASGPYVTQAIPVEDLASELETCQAAQRSDILTGPLPSSADADSYGGLAISQNALNYYVYANWLNSGFQLSITDSQEIAKYLALAPPAAFSRNMVTRIHVWLAVSPRVEIAEQAIIAQQRPLLISMDDIRICFETLGPLSNDRPHQPTTLYELSANLRATGTVTVEWPLVPRLLFDQQSAQVSAASVWELFDPSATRGRSAPTAPWAPLVEAIGAQLLAPYDASSIAAPPSSFPWRNPIPIGSPQELVPSGAWGSFYMDVLAQRRGLYLMPVLSSIFVEFVNGSPAPFLNALLGTPPPPAAQTTLASLTCPQAKFLLRTFIAPIRAVQPFIFPGP